MKDDSHEPADEEQAKKSSLLTKLKIAGITLLLAVVVVVILQNTESVKTQILFMELIMPRAMLLLLAFLVGAAVGFLLAFLRPWRKKKA